MRQLLVTADKVFKIDIPDDAKITFGPWSPPPKGREWQSAEKAGTLRIYQGNKDNILACFSGVTSFRELGLNYVEQVAKEEGAVLWKSDKDGYQREDKVQFKQGWVTPQLPSPKTKRRKQ